MNPMKRKLRDLQRLTADAVHAAGRSDYTAMAKADADADALIKALVEEFDQITAKADEMEKMLRKSISETREMIDYIERSNG